MTDVYKAVAGFQPVLRMFQVIGWQSWRRCSSRASQTPQCTLKVRHPCIAMPLNSNTSGLVWQATESMVVCHTVASL